MEYLQFICLATLGIQMVTSQVLRPPPFNLLNRPEAIIETANYRAPNPTVISEPPCNSLVPLPNVVAEPSTTIITDCSPTICKNLANTIQLMIVCNLLQNTQGSSEMALQLAAPILNEVLSSPAFSCGCANPIYSPVAPNLVAPNVITPNIISPNVITPNLISPNVINPSVISPNIVGPSGVPLTPRVVSPASVCPNSVPSVAAISPSLPIGGQVPNTNALLTTLMSLLGNIQV